MVSIYTLTSSNYLVIEATKMINCSHEKLCLDDY